MATDTESGSSGPGVGRAKPSAATRARVSEHRHLLAGSAALVIGAAVQAATGAMFWLVAARIDTTDDVGQATALFSSVLFVAYLGGLGLPVALARFAPDRDDESHAVFAWGAITTALSTGVIGSAYLFLVDTSATRALTDWSPVGGPVLFVLGCMGASLSLIVDVRWMTVRRWSLVLIRITMTGLGRFPLLLIPTGGAESVHLFFVALAPLALSGYVGIVLLPRVTGGRHRLRKPAETRSFVRYSFVNYLSTLAYQGPQFVLPVIVLLNVPDDVNASFYVAWGITAVGLYVPMAIGQALLSEGGKDGAHLLGQVRVVLLIATGLMTAAAAATWAGRSIVTAVYGEDYSEAARILPALVVAAIPWAITSVFLTEAWVLHRNTATVSITGVLTISIIVPALILVPDDGLDGASQSFLIGNVIAAVVAIGFHIHGLRTTPSVVPEVEPADEIGESLHP